MRRPQTKDQGPHTNQWAENIAVCDCVFHNFIVKKRNAVKPFRIREVADGSKFITIPKYNYNAF